jgi:hypothetical protein
LALTDQLLEMQIVFIFQNQEQKISKIVLSHQQQKYGIIQNPTNELLNTQMGNCQESHIHYII